MDVYKPYFSGMEDRRIWGQYLLADGSKLPFCDDSFHAAVALDVIEHLTKSDGMRMIKEMKRVSADIVLLMTPNGFLPQDDDENSFQTHQSGWTFQDLSALGFRVKGIRGHKSLRTSHSSPVLRPLPFGFILSVLTEPIVRALPGKAFQLYGVYHKKRS
jgi:hypothetical protein